MDLLALDPDPTFLTTALSFLFIDLTKPVTEVKIKNIRRRE
jgi:hypothetical protein